MLTTQTHQKMDVDVNGRLANCGRCTHANEVAVKWRSWHWAKVQPPSAQMQLPHTLK